MREITFLLVLSLLCLAPAIAQSPNATINGIVLDPSGAVIAGAEVVVVNDATGVQYTTKTNGEGIYVVPNLPPGPYRIQVSNSGFKTIIKPDIVIHVQDALAINFTLPIGAASEVVTVQGGAPLVNTENAAVSTVVDRQFAENLPMNGRSFQTLIDLAPGVVITAANPSGYDAGQFNINGQRANSNYWTVDGVSGNIGTSAFFQGDGLGGALGSFSVLGGTNSLVSVDALQEFRIQTSTYAPEFGRTPGGQISIVTRSGTNQFHGTLFDYLRNDVLDANNWFNTSVTPALPKSEERQNDFGGTLAGPILKDKTFFFFSYEGLRLRLPQTTLTTVPCDSSCQVFGNARTGAITAMQPYLNAYPLPNGPEVFTPCTPNVNGCPPSGEQSTGSAQFNASFSNPASLDAYSLRVDHRLNEHVTLFGRYNYSPSENAQRGAATPDAPLSNVLVSRITTQTATVGATFVSSSEVTNDLRFNYSRNNGSSNSFLDTFGGGVLLPSLSLPSPYTSSNARLGFAIFSLSGDGLYVVGDNINNIQQQWNLVDSVSIQKGSHGLKFGIDYRRLTPLFAPYQYGQTPFFGDVPSAQSGNPFFTFLQANAHTKLLFRNLGAFAQDTWRIAPRLSLTYGLRWDVDFSPSTLSGPTFPAVIGFSFADLSQLAVAPAGTPAFRTPYGNVAPRLGVAYQLSQNQDWGTVVRGGFGMFFDLATQQVGNLIGQNAYPFGASAYSFGNFPLNPATATPPSITPPGSGSGTVLAFDPNLKLPYSLEWNVALEQSVGRLQTLSVSYVGSAGRRLIQSAVIRHPNPNYAQADLVDNAATSDYGSLQIQFQRRLSHGLQTLASYTWAHSIDDASAGSIGNGNTLVPGIAESVNRGPSDFDIRSTFSAGVTYDVPAPKINPFTNAFLRDWSVETIVLARSAPPVNVYYSNLSELLNGSSAQVRPDLVSGIPLYLYGPQYPGGKAINGTPGAVTGGCPDGSQSIGPFCPPPEDSNGNPLRQGNLGRNSLRGFGATQWDFAVHRDFPIREALKLQFRGEMFNVLNHPNFGQPVPNLNDPQFGQSTQNLGQFLSGGLIGGGGLSSLYQIGGPRSIQFALKLMF